VEAGAAAPPPPSRKIEAGRVVGEAFDTYKENFGALVGVAIVVFLASSIIETLLNELGAIGSLLATIVRLAALALYTGFVVRLVEDVRDGRRDHSVGDLISSATPVLATLILVGIIWGIGVGIGLLLLIIPGVLLATMWFVTAPSVVAEGRGVFDAFSRSWELVKPQFGSVLATVLLTFLIVIGIYVVAALIGAALGVVGLLLLIVVAGALIAPIWALVASVLFFDLGGTSTSTAGPGAGTDLGGTSTSTAGPGAGTGPADTPPPPPPPQQPQ
jgi:hypothetical protein